MKHGCYAMGFYKVILCLLLSFLFSFSHAALRTFYAEDLCHDKDTTKINLNYHSSGVIAAVPNGAIDCRIKLQSSRGASVVISFYQYMLDEDDILEFQDSNNFRVSVNGEGTFLDERKSLTFEGPLIIHYVTKNNATSYRQKFNLIFTEVHDSPCFSNEFKCQNNKWIPKEYKCDRHNHCGDLSEQKNCSPTEKKVGLSTGEVVIVSQRSTSWIIAIIACSVLLGIVIIAWIAVLIRGCVSKKTQSKQTTIPTQQHPITTPTQQLPATIPTQQLPATNPTQNTQQAPLPSLFGRVKPSIPSKHETTAPAPTIASVSSQTSQNYQVPAMYPQLPSAPYMTGFDNPEFKMDV